MFFRYIALTIACMGVILAESTPSKPSPKEEQKVSTSEKKEEKKETLSKKASDYKNSIKEVMEQFEKLNTELSKVTNNETAKTSAPELKKIAQKIEELKKELKKKEKDISSEEKKQIVADFNKTMEVVGLNFLGHLLRINGADITDSDFEESMGALDTLLNADEENDDSTKEQTASPKEESVKELKEVQAEKPKTDEKATNNKESKQTDVPLPASKA